MWKKYIIGGIVHTTAWAIAFYGIVYLLSDSPSRYSNGVIAGWWFALYIGYVLKIRIQAAVISFLVYILYSIIMLSIGSHSFYHDPPDQFDLFFAFIIVLQALLFASPFAVNFLVRHVIELVRSRQKLTESMPFSK